jgi:hypothetical protein
MYAGIDKGVVVLGKHCCADDIVKAIRTQINSIENVDDADNADDDSGTWKISPVKMSKFSTVIRLTSPLA